MFCYLTSCVVCCVLWLQVRRISTAWSWTGRCSLTGMCWQLLRHLHWKSPHEKVPHTPHTTHHTPRPNVEYPATLSLFSSLYSQLFIIIELHQRRINSPSFLLHLCPRLFFYSSLFSLSFCCTFFLFHDAACQMLFSDGVIHIMSQRFLLLTFFFIHVCVCVCVRTCVCRRLL